MKKIFNDMTKVHQQNEKQKKKAAKHYDNINKLVQKATPYNQKFKAIQKEYALAKKEGQPKNELDKIKTRLVKEKKNFDDIWEKIIDQGNKMDEARESASSLADKFRRLAAELHMPNENQHRKSMKMLETIHEL